MTLALNDQRHNASFIRLLHKNNQAEVLKLFPSIISKSGLLKKPDELYIFIDKENSAALEFDKAFDFCKFSCRRYRKIIQPEHGCKRSAFI
jgi:hypothetical protein